MIHNKKHKNIFIALTILIVFAFLYEKSLSRRGRSLIKKIKINSVSHSDKEYNQGTERTAKNIILVDTLSEQQ